MNSANFGRGIARLVLAALIAVSGVTAGVGATISSARASVARDEQATRSQLRTSGRFIVDSAGRQVHLAAANWYGAESTDFVVGGLQAEPLDRIVSQVR